MKKLFICLILSIVLFGCNTKGPNDVRMVKIGASISELKYIMGEPWSVEINRDTETWYFSYRSNGHNEGLHVTIKDGKVADFYSY